MSKYWVVADTHFGHNRLREYCGRPEGFEERILRGLARVRENDVLIHLGDFCIGDDIGWHLQFMGRVAGKRWLLKGNHDRKSDTWYLAHGWDMVAESVTLRRFGSIVVLSHKPLNDNGFDINIHGHFHNSPNPARHKEDLVRVTAEKHWLVFMEHNYVPVDLRRIVECHRARIGTQKRRNHDRSGVA